MMSTWNSMWMTQQGLMRWFIHLTFSMRIFFFSFLIFLRVPTFHFLLISSYTCVEWLKYVNWISNYLFIFASINNYLHSGFIWLHAATISFHGTFISLKAYASEQGAVVFPYWFSLCNLACFSLSVKNPQYQHTMRANACNSGCGLPLRQSELSWDIQE